MVKLAKDYGLTRQQRSAMLRERNLFLTACPGSGKTTSISGRVAKLLGNGQRLALLSHTKVGARELADSVVRNHGIPLSSDSYSGTIHSFVGRYLLKPFGHMATGSTVPVSMEPDEAAQYYPPNLEMRYFPLAADGCVQFTKRNGSATSQDIQAALAGRLASAKAGVVDYDDGLYWALKLLRDYPKITSALAARFDEIIVDEAQDSNEMQIQILEALHSAKLKSLVMVGDFDQTIYGFSGSSPQRCLEAATNMGLKKKRLTENHRASQLLCNVSAKFRAHSTPDTAVGTYANLGVPPLLVRYDPGKESALIPLFSSLISKYQVQLGNSAMLVRKGDAISAFIADQGPKLPKDIAILLACARGETPLESVRDLERLLTSKAGLSHRNLDSLALRSIAFSAVSGLPALQGDAYAWGQHAVREFDGALQALSPTATLGSSQGRVPAGLKGLAIESIGDLSAQEHRVTTIHGTKGESVDAIMIVASEPEESWHTPQAAVWASPLNKLGMQALSEELRIFYVALTRARQLAVLAVPSSTSAVTMNAFRSAGFQLEG